MTTHVPTVGILRSFPDLAEEFSIRPAAILTLTKDECANRIDLGLFDDFTVEADFTLGSLTQAKLFIEYSDDDVDANYSGSIITKVNDSGEITLIPAYFSLNETGRKQFLVSKRKRYARFFMQGVGTVTSSSLTLTVRGASGELSDDPSISASSSLPSGGATAARQDTGNTSLASIDAKLATLPTPVRKYVTFNGAQTNATVWTPTAGKKVKLVGLKLSTDVANVVDFNGATTGVIDKGSYVADGGFVMSSPDKDTPIVKLAADEVFRITTSGAGNVYVTAFGEEVTT